MATLGEKIKALRKEKKLNANRTIRFGTDKKYA